MGDNTGHWLKAYVDHEDRRLHKKIDENTAELEAALAVEEQERKAADSTLQAGLNKEKSDRIDADAAVRRELQEETAERKAEDNKLNTALNAEKAARESADSVLRGDLTVEVSERKAADAVLQAAIDAETSARGNADADLQTAIETEEQERTASDSALQTALSTHQSNMTNPHGVTKAQVGLGNVDNTADLDKPVSTAAQAAIAAEKAARETADSNLQTALDTEEQERTAADSALQAALNTHKSDKTNPHNVTKAQVGLGNVDNTSDLNKPISAAAQTAINAEKLAREDADADLETALAQKADKTEVLTKTNTTAFTPSGNYQPATKKYVDDSVSAAGGGDMLKAVYDADNDGKVNSADNADKLGGQLPSYYATASAVSTKANTSSVLTKTNTTSFTPTGNYHPATKKYVDDAVSGKGDMLKSVYDTNNNGKADDADKLGGQPPEYYAANVPFYNANIIESYDGVAWIKVWDTDAQNLPNRFNIRLMNNALIVPSSATTSNTETYNLDLFFLSCTNGGNPKTESADYDRTVKCYSISANLNYACAYHMALTNGYVYEFEWHESEQTYILLNPIPIGRNSGVISSAIGFGVARVINNLDRNIFNQGEALSAYQGYVLKNMIDNIAVFPERPTLTALTPVGTTVGSSGWTGTGEFRVANQNTTKLYADDDLTGFKRINLKLASGENWREWSAYYDYNGVEYEFYYSESRGVYETLLPADGKTVAEIVDAVRWVYKCTPDTIRYGASAEAFVIKDTSETDTPKYDATGFEKSTSLLAQIGCNRRLTITDTVGVAVYVKGSLEFNTLALKHRIKLYLTLDVEGKNSITGTGMTAIMSSANAGYLLGVEAIDNWGA